MKKMKMQSVLIRSLALAVLLGSAGNAVAAEGGYSNYIPGSYGDFGMALEPAAKLTLRNDIYFYEAEVDRAVRSGRAEVDVELEFLMDFVTLVYKPGVELFGGQYAFGVFVPFVDLDIEAGVTRGDVNLRSSDDASGIGDVAWIPLLLYWNSGKVHTSLAHFIVSPTGDYDTDNSINASLNYWSFDTNLAMTYLDEEKGQDLSFNLGWIYNTENDDTDYQTGQEIHIDAVANQWFSETLAVGVHGFYLKQVTGDDGSGALLGDFEAEALGVGPAALWATRFGDQDVTFIAKWLAEVDAENRLEGDLVFLSFAMDW